jgi:hypothetical protein
MATATATAGFGGAMSADVAAVLASVYGGGERHDLPPVTRGTLADRLGRERAVTAGDLLWCKLDGCCVRFSRLVPPMWCGAGWVVEVTDAYSGRVLPDYRHPSQVYALG